MNELGTIFVHDKLQNRSLGLDDTMPEIPFVKGCRTERGGFAKQRCATESAFIFFFEKHNHVLDSHKKREDCLKPPSIFP